MMSNLKTLEDELRAEKSKNAVVCIKQVLSIEILEVSVSRSLEAMPVKKALFPTNPPQNQTSFPLPVKARETTCTCLTGL